MTGSRGRLWGLAASAGLALSLSACDRGPEPSLAIEATPEELRAIIKEAYIYGFPIVDSYRIQHSYFVDQANPEYKGGWNEVHNVARVFTPQDTAIQTPNSDTPYSFLGADLRAEPLVISVPAVRDRYCSLQFIDMYTHNSLTMYELPASLLTENPINRYLINSPMERNLVRDTDGGVTLYIQHESPGKDKEANWLPAPKGPFFMIMREYWPKPEALDGSSKAPPAVRAAQ